MSKRGYKITKWIGLAIIFLFVASMAINWFMTYMLEDTLRTRLRSEIVKATDGLYDFSFDKLSVGLFTGELMVKGMHLWVDSTKIDSAKHHSSFSNYHLDLFIDTVAFEGINLTWRFDYRELSFASFQLKHPKIKITVPRRETITSNHSSTKNKSLHESISPYFDVIHSKHIKLERAEVEYIVIDSTTSSYSLKDLDFTAHNFLLDKDSQNKEHLLFSDNFAFVTNTPQIVYDSEHFVLNLDKIWLSTIDSVAQVGGAYLKTKDKYWQKRFTDPGSYSSVMIGDFKLGGILFSRDGAYNFLDARTLSVNSPSIEYYDVKGERKTKKKKRQEADTTHVTSWSLYSITAPLMERISIKDIDIVEAKFMYAQTKDGVSDKYTLNSLNFEALDFVVDSLHKDYNIVNYINDFSINASDVEGHIMSKNVVMNVANFKLSSIEKALTMSDIKLSPISIVADKNYVYGKIKNIEITNINYDTGLKAKLLYIELPQIDFITAKNPTPKKANSVPNNSNVKEANKLLDAVAPFISYLTVDDIVIRDANASFLDRSTNNKYQLSRLHFRAKNFHIDEETRRLRDYFFRWDEYSIRFEDFDNLTPDGKYRVQIKEGDFDSVTGNMLLDNLKVTPMHTDMGSYVNISTPSAILLGLDEKGVRQKKISFKTFILDSPIVEIVKEDDQVSKDVEQEVKSIALNLINFDLLTIPSPSIYYYDATKGMSAQVQSIQMHIDSFKWVLNESFNMHNFVIESPFISIVETQKNVSSGERKVFDISSFGNIDIGKLSVRNPVLKVKTPDLYVDFSANDYLLKSLYWNHRTNSLFQIKELDFSEPTIHIYQENVDRKTPAPVALTRDELIKKISTYANKTELGRINISNFNLLHQQTETTGKVSQNKLTDVQFLVENLDADLAKKKLDVEEVAFSTRDINHPLDSFYTIRIGDIDFSKRNGNLTINKIKLEPSYAKFDFAYKHPRGADWFHVEVDKVKLSGIDASRFISDTMLLARQMIVDKVLLENFKNQKIEIEHNIMPLLYEQFQHFPVKYTIDDLDIRDFTVLYEELAKNGSIPARIPFSNMHGRTKGFTNIQKNDNAFYTFHADGLLMATAPFVAEWKIPIDSTNDKFYLSATIRDVDMRTFNQLVRPMAPAYVESGRIDSLWFSTEATSLGATVDMRMAYDSLYIVLLKNMDGHEKNTTLTKIINKWGIEKSNYGSDFRTPHHTIVRDPYHSNFNYFWQILQPPLVESVGVSEEKQTLAHNIITIFNRVKTFFVGEKKKKKHEKSN